jgi:6,7-dimethyl-8-ribityllumazine synthase
MVPLPAIGSIRRNPSAAAAQLHVVQSVDHPRCCRYGLWASTALPVPAAVAEPCVLPGIGLEFLARTINFVRDMSSKFPGYEPADLPETARVAIVAARFNHEIVDELLNGCLRRLSELEVDGSRVEIHRVPGAFELPVAAKMLARTKKFSSIICLGCIVRGDTPHFDYVAGEAARGIQQVALEEMIPVIFGVLTVNTEEQAQDRIGGKHHYGERAAEAAAEMMALAIRIQHRK